MEDKLPESCPHCGHSPLTGFLYGLYAPTPELDAKIAAGSLEVAGCCVPENAPLWRCSKCAKTGGRFSV